MFILQLRKQFNLKDLGLLLVALICIITAGFINRSSVKPILKLTKQDTALNINKHLLLFFSLGNKRLLADALWIQTLLESDEEHYKEKDLNSWMYHRFMSITLLDELFYENYLYGGLYLSIVKDDVQGASEIFQKGLIHYPSDYKLNFYTGFNYYFEQGNFEEGLKYLKIIENHPDAPIFIKKIVGRLQFEISKDYDVAIEFIKYQYANEKEPSIKLKLKADLYALQAEKDLECLNQKHSKDQCRIKDAEGTPYLFKENSWHAPKAFVPYRIHFPKR